MMKRFFKQVLISTLGFLLAFGLLVAIVLGIILVKSKPTPPKLSANSVLHIPLRGVVVEHKPKSTLEVLGSSKQEYIDLVVLKKAIQDAQKDDRIQGIYLQVGNLVAGWASLEEIRKCLKTFQESGKFIIAYGEHYTNRSYYLASLADEIVLHPAGDFIFNGLNLTVYFYKQLLDKLGVNPEVFKVGRYKSAVEPFTSYGMSEASKYQSNVLLHTFYAHMLGQIAIARKLTVAALQNIANDVSVLHPQGVYQASLITRVGHQDDAEAWMGHRLGIGADASINYIHFTQYPGPQQATKKSPNQIAVLVAAGVIMDNPEMVNTIHTKRFVDSLRKLRKDPNVKAIVLRINSPGGSALASDTMWKELMLTKAVKPIVASMSDIAASGGYYLATACHPIIAHPTTITGSIGVFNLYFNMDKLLKDKIGITRDGVKTSPSADVFAVSRPLTNQERAALQKYVERTYAIFLERVATSRHMDPAEVARLAEGRVWPGTLAKENGLIDELGGLEEAIERAASLAGVKDSYRISYWPKPSTWLEQLFSEWNDLEDSQLMRQLAKRMGVRWGLNYAYLDSFQELESLQGVQARLPYKLEIE